MGWGGPDPRAQLTGSVEPWGVREAWGPTCAPLPPLPVPPLASRHLPVGPSPVHCVLHES